MYIQYLNKIVNKPNVMPGNILYCTSDCIPVELMFQENFPSNKQVWNRLRHRMTADREERSELPFGAMTVTSNRSGTTVIRRSSIPPHTRVGSTTRILQNSEDV